MEKLKKRRAGNIFSKNPYRESTHLGRDLLISELGLIINRSTDLPIHAQISNYFRNIIIDGSLNPGTPLPSIRKLAQALSVAVSTVSRAYKDLSSEWFIESQPGSGSIVALNPPKLGDSSIDRYDQLQSVIQPAAERARSLGFEWDDIIHFLEEYISISKTSINITFIASSTEIINQYLNILNGELADKNVCLNPISLEEIGIENGILSRIIQDSNIIVVMAESLYIARELFDLQNKQVIPLITELSISTHAQLAEIPANGSILLVCEESRHNYLIWLIGLYFRPTQVKWFPNIPTSDCVDAIKAADAILYDGNLRSDQISQIQTKTPIVILHYVINYQSLQQLHKLLLQAPKYTHKS
jgi:GntR family transcriptional regulator